MSTERASCWSVTINNPTDLDDDLITEANARAGWSVEGQLEQGANGTEHYQLMVTTPQVRFSSIKKAFPRAHIEAARNPKHLAKYVTKEDTRVGVLPKNDMYPSQSSFYTLLVMVVKEEEAPKHWPTDAESLQMMVGKSKDPLEQFDTAVKTLISRGYHVEHHGCNPQVRSAWRLYRNAMITRFDLETKLAKDKLEAKAIEDAAALESKQDSELHEEQSSECSREGSEEGDEEDDWEGSESDSEGTSETSGECSE